MQTCVYLPFLPDMQTQGTQIKMPFHPMHLIAPVGVAVIGATVGLGEGKGVVGIGVGTGVGASEIGASVRHFCVSERVGQKFPEPS